jgi:DNA-binding transcriptional MerR regulator
VGVLPRAPRTRSGYRQYPPETAGRVIMVRRALTLGFSLAELARIFRVRERGGVPCREVRRMAGGKLVELEQRIADLNELRDQLRTLLADWDARLDVTPDGMRAELLETLARKSSGKGKT